MPSLLTALQKSRQIILSAPPGAGKSTRLPLALLKSGAIRGKIIMLEPRRLAARNIARYLAQQLGEPVGQTVGFRMRGENKTSQHTRLEIVTEGVMTRLLQADPELSEVGLLIFDEFHERSMHADTALAFSLDIQQALRDDLSIIVMSATLEVGALSSMLPEATYLESQGRCFSVEHRYVSTASNERLAVSVIKQVRLLLAQEQGSILVFLPGVAEIKHVVSGLSDLASDIDISPLYGQLDQKMQQRAILPVKKGGRKVVLATNIAETSLTIEGIRIVVDCGLERAAHFDLNTGITKLETQKIAQSSAVQRAGRAGRLEPGICIRLYSQESFGRMVKSPQPDILKSDLSSFILELAQWGVKEVNELSLLDIPTPASINQARELLSRLGLLDKEQRLTAMGREAQRLGCEPRYCSILLNARQWGESALQTALHLIPLLEEPYRGEKSIDLLDHVNWSLSSTLRGDHKQQQRTLRRHYFASKMKVSLDPGQIDRDWLGVLLAMGFPDRIALSKGEHGFFQLANGHGAVIADDQSLANSNAIVAIDLLKSSGSRSRIFLAHHCSISELQQKLPQLFSEVKWIDWDERRNTVVAELRLMLGSIVINTKPLTESDSSAINHAMLTMIRRKGLSSLNWSKSCHALLSRVRCAQLWLNEHDWPRMDDDALLDELELWLLPYMLNIKNIKGLNAINLLDALKTRIGWERMKIVEQQLPTQFLLPTGNHTPITYQEGVSPVISVRMQEMFGEQSSPTVANQRIKVTCELLSPARRPLQITQDLSGFWVGSYKEVQKEMKGRYPKHVWPDDPANHKATNKTKRHLNS
ncbi:ATP-dependent helicase HrpB [Aliivibrio kagoshimensis]|uniref:ATP-dependent helicase HrpB n=1 Tax=Aliivibrio kagoshimensis TaxID=2910230 RepID=UPI003D0F4A5E